jgi:hypothetical protein
MKTVIGWRGLLPGVVPAQAGSQSLQSAFIGAEMQRHWIPACAGMTRL